MIYKMYYLQDDKSGMEIRPMDGGVVFTFEPDFDETLSRTMDLSKEEVLELIKVLKELID